MNLLQEVTITNYNYVITIKITVGLNYTYCCIYYRITFENYYYIIIIKITVRLNYT
jgi:hypothetical protein